MLRDLYLMDKTMNKSKDMSVRVRRVVLWGGARRIWDQEGEFAGVFWGRAVW